ncbi:hypothetical protein [Embleya scabrispora]|uniref:hypothetical protein n=1 Tax=Embleya scabrispora TaxID=159449 RepID=UPI00131A2AE3|nr:hypothetical protein [Embleya scabrispora]MYS81655.1 hypothetical protein [Streptomyces sp. SID5474]
MQRIFKIKTATTGALLATIASGIVAFAPTAHASDCSDMLGSARYYNTQTAEAVSGGSFSDGINYNNATQSILIDAQSACYYSTESLQAIQSARGGIDSIRWGLDHGDAGQVYAGVDSVGADIERAIYYS